MRDIGDDLTWPELKRFLENLPPTADSALYRAQHPRSWWWTPDHDFLSAVLNAVQWGNWQRSGGKGDKPRLTKRPQEKRVSKKESRLSAAELRERRKQTVTILRGGDTVGH